MKWFLRFGLPRLAIVLLAVLAARCLAQSVPAERPRARPPGSSPQARWEEGVEMFKRIKVPPAPPLAPAEALETFKIVPGYRLELVAAEPMVQSPISFEFDPDGRIWVVEYQGYMRDIKGTGEADPICRVVVLEDTNGDGRADKSTVFLDRLVMPRSLAFVKGGVLVQEPPKLWFCEDTDGDLRCDRKTEVGRMGVAGNPQHTDNGLRYGLDNWLHSADSTKRHRWTKGRLEEEETISRGQFGITFDESGRAMTCIENSALHADLFPAEYLARNRPLAQVVNVGRTEQGFNGVGVNIAIAAQEIYPIRVTPGITWGALELRDDGRLRTYTVASGICYYDGDQFPDDARGNVFVPDSGGHLIGRLKLRPGIRLEASRFYPAEQEFLASTDERFRPVNARVGPDGALYLADMYHGILEHVIFLAPWITDQVRDRELDKGNDMGRIYRVVRVDRPLNHRSPKLTAAKSADLVAHLSHATGWWRLTAQRLLVERADPAAISLLADLARRGSNALGRLHALWTLDGLGALDTSLKFAALDDADERVRAAAVRLSERGLNAQEQETMVARLGRAADDRSEMVRLQATLTASRLSRPDALPLLARLARENVDPLFQTGALTGLAGRELEFVRLLFAPPRGAQGGSAQERRLAMLGARCVMKSRDARRIAELFDLIGEVSAVAWQRSSLLDALAVETAPGSQRVKPLALAREPVAITKLTRDDDVQVRQTAYRLMELFTWPGAEPLAAAGVDLAPLSPAEQKRIASGRESYQRFCAPCHQPDGGGAANVAPPLAGSEWVAGPPERIIRVILHGLYGPVKVNNQTWNLSMPGLGGAGVLDDEQIAGIVSYVRRAWGNTAAPVDQTLVAGVRRETGSRTLPWSAGELAAVAGTDGPAETRAPLVRPLPSGEILLPASKAVVYAQRLAYRSLLDRLAPWTVAEDLAEWRVELPVGGQFEVRVNLAADGPSAGDYFVVETEGSQARGVVPDTGDFDHFREQRCDGKLRLSTGVNRILMRPDGPLKRELADVRGVRLIPVR